MLGDNSPPSCLKTKNKYLASKARASYLLLNASATKSTTTLDDRLSVTHLTPFCCETLLRRATGALAALPLPFHSFFATAAFSACPTSKLSSNLTVLGSVLLRANGAACLPSTWCGTWSTSTSTPTLQTCKTSTSGVRWCGMVYVLRWFYPVGGCQVGKWGQDMTDPRET